MWKISIWGKETNGNGNDEIHSSRVSPDGRGITYITSFHFSSLRPHDLTDVRAQSKEADSTLQMDWACSCSHRRRIVSMEIASNWENCLFLLLYHTHRATTLVHPDAALLLLCIRGLESQEVLPCTEPVIVTQHAHDQEQRVAVQHVLKRVED